MTSKEWQSARYYRLKAAGLCTRCMKPVEKSKALCNECAKRRKKQRQEYEFGKYWARRNEGKCVRCGDAAVNTFCATCAQIVKLKREARVSKRIEQGYRLCASCKTILPKRCKFMTCDSCRERHHEQTRKRRERRMYAKMIAGMTEVSG